MNREEHERELQSSHARDEAEERHEKRMKDMREIDEGMKEILNHEYKNYDREPF